MLLFRKRRKLKSELEFYKVKYFDAVKYNDDIKKEKNELEVETAKLRDEIESLKQDKKKLEDENLAKYNIIQEERRKNSKRERERQENKRTANKT